MQQRDTQSSPSVLIVSLLHIKNPEENDVRTEITEHHWEEYKSVSHSQECNDEVQPEEENLDELRFGKRQHDDAWQVSHSNTSKHLEGAKKGKIHLKTCLYFPFFGSNFSLMGD